MIYRNTRTQETMDVVPGSALHDSLERERDWVRVKEAASPKGAKAKVKKSPADDGGGSPDDGTTGTKPATTLGLDGLTHDELIARATAVEVPNPDDYPSDGFLANAIVAVVGDAGALGDDLADLSRAQLDIRAAAVGVIDPANLPNKGAVIEAIEAASPKGA